MAKESTEGKESSKNGMPTSKHEAGKKHPKGSAKNIARQSSRKGKK